MLNLLKRIFTTKTCHKNIHQNTYVKYDMYKMPLGTFCKDCGKKVSSNITIGELLK